MRATHSPRGTAGFIPPKPEFGRWCGSCEKRRDESRPTFIQARGRHGFTLIELLVVVGIIVVLIAIALPVLARARKTATRSRIASDLQNLSQAAGILPPGFQGLSGHRSEHHQSDHRDEPQPTLPSPPADRVGAVTLCWAAAFSWSRRPKRRRATVGTPDPVGFRLRTAQP